ncbi:MAG: AAA family ATPase [Methanosarcinales archaeon]|jgi:energy-coupling factor transporter ATP-binding protein EcfA2|nr:AAA family ATPase [Methanosarcinales archaeon]
MVSNGIAMKKKNSNVRKLTIKDFRNVGITFDEKERPAELVLNRGLNKEDLGDLVLLVGPNNSGKSNVLAALEAFGSKKLEEDDSPDFIHSTQKPAISMFVQDNDKINSLEIDGSASQNNEISISKKIGTIELEIKNLEDYLKDLRSEKLDIIERMDAIKSERNKNKNKYPTELERKLISDLITNRTIGSDGKADLEIYLARLKNGQVYNNTPNLISAIEKRLLELKEQGSNANIFSNLEEISDQINLDMKTTKEKIVEKSKTILSLKSQTDTKKTNFKKSTAKTNSKDPAPLVEETEEASITTEHDYLLSSRIVVYTQKPIKQQDLVCKPDKPTAFIKNVLKIMGQSQNALDDIYSKYEGKSQKSYLEKFGKKLNKELPGKITKYFNDMYFCDAGEEYAFKFDFESEKIHILLDRGDVTLDLDKQSTGFRWFFDFFFNFAYKEDLKPGDIIIMDEPATNIHVSGQFELRKFLKDFAQKNGLTFVISTHSPFLIDCDYLDELRLMQRDEHGHVIIEDKFDVVSRGADKLDFVLRGLTVGRHILIGDQKVIFTEGITDYNYLTAFKLLFVREKQNYNSLVFLPVGGIGNNIADILSEIDTNPRLLVDADRQGLSAKNKSKEKDLIISLNEVNPSYKNLESLFSSADAKKYNLKDKEWNESSLFKKKIFENEITDETKDNFKKVLDHLLTV